MRYLLDTHVWLWMLMDSPRLGPITRERLSSPDAQRIVSAVSFAEVAIKHALGKLPLPCGVERLKLLGRFEMASFDPALMWIVHFDWLTGRVFRRIHSTGC